MTNIEREYMQARQAATQANKGEYDGQSDRGSLLNEAKNKKFALARAKQSSQLSLQQRFLKGAF